MTTEPFAGLDISFRLPLEKLQGFKPEQLRAIFSGIAEFIPLAGGQGSGKVQALSSTALSTPKPAFRVGQPRPNTWSTEPRKDVLRRMYPSVDPWHSPQQIHDAVAACEGPTIPKWSTLTVYAIQTLHLKRGAPPKTEKPPRARKQRPQRGYRTSAPIVAIETPRAEPGVELPPFEATWDTIQRQALRQGFELRSHSDLPVYNKQRIARGEAPFCIHRARAA